ncbi:MAG TPA: gamma-glutamyltransferase [Thermoanaerobaculia bacterium]|nr:gamma-glutamyltransferase [Thermoanaerobaculia bacterium]
MRRPLLLALFAHAATAAFAQEATQKPPLHAKHWVGITGKPLAATAGAMTFQKGGNAVDAACAMLAAAATQWDTLSWGGETQALIYNPKTKKVIAVNALGMAPTGATPEFYRSKLKADEKYPPEYGPLAAVTPGTPGGLMTMLAEYGKLSLKDVLAPAIEMADGFPIEGQLSRTIERQKSHIKEWPYSKSVMLPHSGDKTREAAAPGEVFKQPELAATLRKLVDAEQQALKKGKNRRDAIYAAYDRFYKGDIAQEIARSVQEQGGLITTADLANWKVKLEEPTHSTYKDIDVYKLNVWSQGPVLLQTLNILENFDLKSMGFNSARYIHTIYQAMSLAFADRDFYYGDPDFPPAEPTLGLLSKDYARDRAKLLKPDRNDPDIEPGDPYPYQRDTNPFTELLKNWKKTNPVPAPKTAEMLQKYEEAFYAGTTSVQAADEEGWVVSMTPSGGWVPAVIAGKTGIGLSQRMQSFVLDPAEAPYNVLEPGKRPRVTLTPSLALKNGKPYLSFAVQGGDSQDQNLLQFFLDVVEFGMTPQEAVEAPNVNSFQMRSSFGKHESTPGKILVNDMTPPYVRSELKKMGYDLTFGARTSGPINAIMFDQEHGTMWGASSNHGEDYGIAW